MHTRGPLPTKVSAELCDAVRRIEVRLRAYLQGGAGVRTQETAALAERAPSCQDHPVERAWLLDGDASGSASAAERLPGTLAALSACFALTPFEAELLLLCAAVELDGTVAALLGEVIGEARPAQPTFSLALAVLPAGHWSALTPSAPLRAWRLLSLGRGSGLVYRPLVIDEQILHYLMGCAQPAGELLPYLTPLTTGQLTPGQGQLAAQLADCWRRDADPPLVLLDSADPTTRRSVIATAAAALGRTAWALNAACLPLDACEELAVLCAREAQLHGSVLCIEADTLPDDDGERLAALHSLLDRMRGPAALSGIQPMMARPTLRLTIEASSPREQHELWRAALGDTAPITAVDRLAQQFTLNASQIAAVCTSAARGDAEALWSAARAQARPQLEGLARHIVPRASWEDLVLPTPLIRSLRSMIAAVRQRSLVHEQWGFASTGERGLGISALFVGVSGTGKTSAAELIAAELALDLYQIDLSAVLSKYIGETEKQLRHIFDAAESGGAILLFDEADALFGKRSEVKDSHDRYANLEVSYLLQRVEQYRGLAILTSNARHALDAAFLRRLRYVLHFPFPDFAQREQIWRRAFPSAAPVKDLDYSRLAQLNLAGGNIRNIALAAAYSAADADEAIAMVHIADAARAELSKLERPASEAAVITASL
jgi:hypothetical protein